MYEKMLRNFNSCNWYFRKHLRLVGIVVFFLSFATYSTHGYDFRVDDKKNFIYLSLKYIYLKACQWYITIAVDYLTAKGLCESRSRFYELAWNLIINTVSYDLKINMVMSFGFVGNDFDKDVLFYKIKFCPLLKLSAY